MLNDKMCTVDKMWLWMHMQIRKSCFGVSGVLVGTIYCFM